MDTKMEQGTFGEDEVGSLLAEAQALHAAGEAERAGSLYEQVVGVAPNNAAAWHGLGLLALQIGETATAIDLLQEAVACDPTQPAYYADLGEAQRRLGKVDEAITLLDRAREMGGDNFGVLLNLGCAYGQRGDFEAARDLLNSALAQDPTRADGYYNLGVVEQRDGQYKRALAHLRMAVALRPSYASAWSALGETLRRIHQKEEAQHCFRRALEISPNLVDAVIGEVDLALDAENLEEASQLLESIAALAEGDARIAITRGRLCEAEGDEEAALAHYQHAVALAPHEKDAYRCQAALYRGRKEYEKALECLLIALSHNDNNCELMLDLAGLCQRDLEYQMAGTYFYKQVLGLRPTHVPTLNAAGDSMSDAGLHKEAIECLSKAVELEPDNGESWMLLGYAQFRDGKMEDAIVSNEKALALDWQPHIVHNNLGNILHRLGDAGAAVEHYERALELAPTMLTAKGNLATAYFDMGRFAESEAMFKEAEAIPVDNKMYAPFRLNRGFCHLSSGRLEEGWADYDFRSAGKKPRYPHPEWNGEPLEGKTILIYQDQGVGDVVMFGSMYQEVIDRAGRCIIECAPKLVPLMRRSFPKAWVVSPAHPQKSTEPNPLTQSGIDFQVAQGSLGRFLRRRLEDFPAENTDYLRLDRDRAAYWREHFAALGRQPKIGICWRSKVMEGGRSLYYTSLDMWGDIFRHTDALFVNLQYDDCGEELAMVQEKFGTSIYVPENVDMFNDLDETTSLISALDLVITAPTSVAMLSAGAGIPTWQLFTATAMGWTCFGTDRNLWFSDIQVYKRQWNQPWPELLSQVGDDLGRFLQERCPAA